ncbi:hypothetical protein [Armatimonas sp.]|uniref:hypothetical protein n=1 Tax=Armatimonas sp. TaxID=1872638 RepID=UPI003752227C
MTREDAEDFLIQLDDNLVWERHDNCPPPPLDRVELARRLLEQVNPIDDSPGAPFDSTRLMRQPDHIQVDWLMHSDSDLLTDRIWKELGKPANIGDLFDLLERIYQARWRRGWVCGAAPDASQKVNREILAALRAVTSNPDATFENTEHLTDKLTPQQGRDLCWELDWVGYEGRTRLVEQATSFLTGVLEIVLILGGLVLILLALLGYLNGWVAVCSFIGLVGLVTVSGKRTGDFRWRKPALTFGELASELQERARDEYEEMKGAAHDAG